jgi:hypothetical protein
LGPAAVPPGVTASNTERDLGYLNAERERWGLPGGIRANALWSQACAAHDTYMADNHVIENPEDLTSPGYSPGGAWAGEESVLAGTPWTASANPWEDAPLHLDQLMSPGLSTVGIDESSGDACVTTWPGMAEPALPTGTVLTYPGNGASGLPPSELAEEKPVTAGQFVGVPNGTLTGRELFVYEAGALRPVAGRLHGLGIWIAAASLSSPAGPVPVAWVDSSTSQIGTDLAGAIIIPLKPLASETTYTASVALSGGESIPPVIHRWSFTTGPANPSGHWPSAGPEIPVGGTAAIAPRLDLGPLFVRPQRFRASTPARGESGGRIEATLSYSDSEAGLTRIDLFRRMPGRTEGSECVAPSRRNRHAAPCLRLRLVASVYHRDKAGQNRVTLRWPTGGSGFPAGTYTLQAVARLAGATSHPSDSTIIVG